MTEITQKKLVSQLQSLKNIKPRQEWASLLKSQILSGERAEVVVQKTPVKTPGFMSIFSPTIFKSKTAYAFATLLFLVVGVLGFAQYTMPGDVLFPVKKLAEQSSANLVGQTALNQDIAKLSNRINDLALVSKEGKTSNVSPTISEISENASILAKNIKENKINDPVAIKEIAVSLKTLASVSGVDSKLSTGVKDLYETIVETQISDLEKSTLTDEQKEILTKAQDLYKQEKYADALEQILLINK